MSRFYERRIPRIGDKALLGAFREVAEQFDISIITVQTLTNSSVVVQLNDFPGEQLKRIVAQDGQVIAHVSLVISRFATMNVNRNREQASPQWEHLFFDQGPDFHSWPVEDRLKLDETIAKAFNFTNFADLEVRGNPDAFEILFNQYESSFANLRAMLATQTEKAIEQRRWLDEQTLIEKGRLQDEFRSKEADLKERIQKREAALVERIKGADESDAKTARRAIRLAMLEDAKSRVSDFGVSDRTSRKRLPVQVAFIVLVFLLFVLALAGWSDSRLVWQEMLKSGANQDPSAYWSELIGGWIRLSFATIGIVGALLYYIRWEMRWADMHASSEMQLQQFHIDVNRANWVIESALEWKKETDEVVPNDLLNQLSKNLFLSKADEQAKQVLHPADELASALVGSASKLKLNIAGNELEYDKPRKIPN
ncbi:MAG: hypothetical protein MUF44_04070 [Hydrogenophaga sp.]|jgi:hypothetical protein|nr:hypothetical protein [Hydrogenophaga sp.]